MYHDTEYEVRDETQRTPSFQDTEGVAPLMIAILMAGLALLGGVFAVLFR